MQFIIRRKIVRSLGIGAGSLALLGLSIFTATAATDTSPPTWSKKPTASIPLGAVLSFGQDNCGSQGTPGNTLYRLSPITIDFAATDPQSGIDHYTLVAPEDSDANDIGLTTRITAYSSNISPSGCGGGQDRSRGFQAFNGVGLASSWVEYRLNNMGYREDSPAGAGNAKAGNIPGTLTYSGQWAASACTCWTAGTTQKTTQSGASVRFTFSAPVDTGTTTSWAIGLVMPKGPDRGRAAVYVDGSQVATIDTNSAQKVNGTVVWRQTVSAGSHTLRIVNLATPGHPRIDLDTIVMVRKS